MTREPPRFATDRATLWGDWAEDEIKRLEAELKDHKRAVRFEANLSDEAQAQCKDLVQDRRECHKIIWQLAYGNARGVSRQALDLVRRQDPTFDPDSR